MTFDQFTIQLDRLKSAFGDRFYPGERCKYIWTMVSDQNTDAFAAFVGKCIGESTKAPMADDFREFSRQESRRNLKFKIHENTEKSESGATCRHCVNGGQLLAVCKADKSIWSFVCTFCERAKLLNLYRPFKDSETGEITYRTKWNDSFLNKFTLAANYEHQPEQTK